MRRSSRYLAGTAALVLLLICAVLDARLHRPSDRRAQAMRAGMVQELALTDLCLFTEARYTRHPAMADLHTPFQDHPMAFEHFPSGSLVSPPARFVRRHAQ